jgi:hypothetical protein
MPLVGGKRKVYVGIDPGQSGGLVCLYDKYVSYSPMLDTERDIWSWIQAAGFDQDAKAIIEKVHSMPQQGVASSFKFGKGYGGLRMALVAADVSFDEVTPQTWQKALNIPQISKQGTQREWKDLLRAKAQQLYPKLAVWKESKTQQLKVADALLIATYCKRLHEGKL